MCEHEHTHKAIMLFFISNFFFRKGTDDEDSTQARWNWFEFAGGFFKTKKSGVISALRIYGLDLKVKKGSFSVRQL